MQTVRDDRGEDSAEYMELNKVLEKLESVQAGVDAVAEGTTPTKE